MKQSNEEKILSILEGFQSNFKSIDQRFEKIDQRFEQIDRRFEQIDRRFEQIDQKFIDLEYRFDRKLEALEVRFDAKLEALENRLDAKIDYKLMRFYTTVMLPDIKMVIHQELDRKFEERFEPFRLEVFGHFDDLYKKFETLNQEYLFCNLHLSRLEETVYGKAPTRD